MHFKAVGQRSMTERRTAKRAEMSQVALYSIVSDCVRSQEVFDRKGMRNPTVAFAKERLLRIMAGRCFIGEITQK